jgi:hypothetical protein
LQVAASFAQFKDIQMSGKIWNLCQMLMATLRNASTAATEPSNHIKPKQDLYQTSTATQLVSKTNSDVKAHTNSKL